MGKAKIGAIIALDGEKEYKQAVSSINAETKTLQSVLRNVQEQYKGQANTLTALQAKQKALSEVMAKQKEKYDSVRTGLEHAKTSQDKVSKGLEELKKRYQEASDKMQRMERSSETTEDELQNQRKELQNLSEAIQRGERNLETAGRRVNNWQMQLNNAGTELIRMNRDLNETERCMSEANRSADGCAHSMDRFGNQIEQTEADVKDLRVAVDTALGNLFSGMIQSCFSKIIDLSKQAVQGIYNVGSSFEAQMSTVEALSGASGDALGSLQEKAKEIGATTKFTATEAGEGLEYMALAGWDVNEMLNGIDGVISATAASGLELSQVSDILTDSMTAFGDSAQDANRYADVLATTQAKSNTNISMLGEAYKNCAATAGAYGYSLESVSAALGAMANAGIKGSMAGTNLSIIMTRLATNTNGARDKLQALGVEFYNSDGSARDFNVVLEELCRALANKTTQEKAEIATIIAGKNAQKSLNAIINQGADAYDDLYGQLMNCDGAAQQMADTMNDNLKGKLTILQSSMEAVGVSIFEYFQEPMKEAVEEGANGFTELNERITSGDLKNNLELLGKQTGVLAKEAINLGVKAIPKVTQALSWIMNHGSDITAMLKGMAVALGGMAATKGITGMANMFLNVKNMITAATASMRSFTVTQTAATVATEAETAATVQATVAQEGLNMAQKANVFGLIISLVAGAATALYEYATRAKEASAEVRAYVEEVETERENLKSNIEAYKESEAGTQREWKAKGKLVDRLYELNDVTEKTVGQKQEMKAIVDQLKNDIPGLADAYDEQTSSMKMTNEQLDKYIERQKDQAVYDNAKESLVGLAENVEEAEEKIETLRKKIQDTKEEYHQQTGYEYDEFSGAFSDEWIRKIEAYEEELKKLKGTRTEAQEQLDSAKQTVQEYGTKLDESQTSLQSFSDAEGNMAASTSDMTQSQLEDYQSLQEEIAKNIDACIQAFDKFDGGQKMTADEMLTNLDSQISGIENWSNNMQTLAGQAGKGMSNEFYEQLLDMGPESANLVQTLVDSLRAQDGKFEGICERWTQKMGLESSMSTALADTKVATEQGTKDIYESLRSALEKASNNVLTSGQNMNAEWKKALTQAKENSVEIPQGLVSGISEGTISVQKAVELLNQKMTEKLNTQKDPLHQMGADFSEKIAEGTKSKSSEVKTAAENVAQAGVNAGNAKKSDYITMGRNLGLGIGVGITSESATVAQAVKNVTKNALEVAKKEADIHSPSRKWRDELGAMMGQGMALGIEQQKMTVARSTQKLCAQALDRMKDSMKSLVSYQYVQIVDRIKKLKKSYQLSLEQEKKYWKEAAEYAKKGSDSWKNALKKAAGIEQWQGKMQKRISAVFNVSEYTTGAKGEQQKKTTKQYYNEIYQAAVTYFDNYKVIHTVSLRQEEDYWKRVVRQMKKGTQAYYDALKQLNSVKNQITTAKKQAKEQAAQEKQEKQSYGVSGNALSAYETYYNVSEKAEVDYWNTVRKQYKKGTEERLQADQKYYAAKEQYNTKLEELNKEYAENVKSVNEDLKESIQELTDAYNEAVEERKQSIYSSVGLFDEFSSTSESGEKLLYNLKTQVAGYADWEQQLEELSAKGKLDPALLQELQEMGPEASASIHALNMLTQEQLEEYNKLWEQKNALAESQAVKEKEQLRLQTEEQIEQQKADAKKQIAALKEAYTKALDEVKAPMEKALQKLAARASTIGEEAALKYITGITKGATSKDTTAKLEKVNTRIEKKLGELPKAGKTIGDNTLQGILDGLTNKKKMDKTAQEMIEYLKKAIQEAADIHSPSRVFKREVGVQISAGVAEGIDDKKEQVVQAGTGMIQQLLEEQKEQLANQKEKLQAYKTVQMPAAVINSRVTEQTQTMMQQNIDSSGMLSVMNRMLDMMCEYLPQIGQAQIVTDTGAVIGEMSTGMSRELAMRTRRLRH